LGLGCGAKPCADMVLGGIKHGKPWCDMVFADL